MINLIRNIYGNDYFDEDFYDRKVIKNYIKKTYDKKGGVWKGIFFKGELIGQMLAIIENYRVVLKLTMLKQEFRKSGMMLMLSASMIKEIKNYNKNDFRSIFAYVDSNNTPIIKILKRFKFIEVGKIPFFEQKKILIYCKVPFNSQLIIISLHPRLAENIKENVEKLGLKRTLLSKNISFKSNTSKVHLSIKMKKTVNPYPAKYQIFSDGKVIAHFLENKQKDFWYDFIFVEDTPIMLKNLVMQKILCSFEKSSRTLFFSLIADANDVKTQEMLLNLNLQYCGYLPFYFGSKDGILFGKIKLKKIKQIY
ncbi:MAG: hypothetical protein ACFFAS_12940 [Promethearchaeota archaeon]